MILFLKHKNIILKFFLEECKYFIKEKKIYNYITDNAEICSDSDEDNSDEEIIEKNSDKEKNSDEEDSSEDFSEEGSSEEESDEKILPKTT